jgi:iron complex transport system substrate-binding protein
MGIALSLTSFLEFARIRVSAPVSFSSLKNFRKFQKFCCLFLCILFVCSAEANCVQNYDPNTDYFPAKFIVQQEYFSVKYFNSYKVVNNVRTNETFFLYMCGTPAPTIPSGTKSLQIPLNTIGNDETVTLAFLELLGLRQNIKYMDVTYVTSPCTLKLAQLGEILPLEDPYGNLTIRQKEINMVDAVFGGSDADPTEPKVISQSISEDPGALRRAEWIGFVSLFFNLEQLATTIYSGIQSRYQCHSQMAISLGVTKSVVWITYDPASPYNDNTTTWTLSNSAYKQQFVQDAGGISPQLNQTVFYTLDQLHAVLKNIDIVIDETYYLYGDTFPVFLSNVGLLPTSSFPFVKNNQVWREDRLQDANEGLDWLETALAEADVVLEDMISIIHPELHDANHQLTWFRNIARNETTTLVTSQTCVDPTAPLVSPVDNCVFSSKVESIHPAFALILFIIYLQQ